MKLSSMLNLLVGLLLLAAVVCHYFAAAMYAPLTIAAIVTHLAYMAAKWRGA